MSDRPRQYRSSIETFRPCSLLYFFFNHLVNIYSKLTFQTSENKTNKQKKCSGLIDFYLFFYLLIFEWGLETFYWMGDVIILEKSTGNWVTMELCWVRLMGHEENRSCGYQWIRNLVSEAKAEGKKIGNWPKTELRLALLKEQEWCLR